MNETTPAAPLAPTPSTPAPAVPAPETAPAAAAPPAAQPAFDWRQVLGESYGRHERLLQAKGWKGPADVLKSYAGLESMIGTEKVALPGKSAPPEAWDAVWNRLGRPESPEGYAFAAPAEGTPYAEETAQKFRQAAHAAGLTAKQAAALHDWWLGEATAGQAATLEQGARAEGELARKLETAWGSDKEARLDAARRAARHFGLGEQQLARLESVAGDFRLLEGLAAIGAQLGEDSLVGRQTAMATQGQAEAEIRRLRADPDFRRAYVERSHPGHDEAVRRMSELAERANPFAVARAGR